MVGYTLGVLRRLEMVYCKKRSTSEQGLDMQKLLKSLELKYCMYSWTRGEAVRLELVPAFEARSVWWAARVGFDLSHIQVRSSRWPSAEVRMSLPRPTRPVHLEGHLLLRGLIDDDDFGIN